MIQVFAALFLAGLFVKIADNYADKYEKEKPIAILFGVLYGVSLAYAMTKSIEAATVFTGVILAVAIAKKLDSIAHMIGIVVVLLSLLFANSIEIGMFIALLFFFAALLDEWLNDNADEITWNPIGKKAIKIIADNRLIAEILGLGIFIAIGKPDYWLSLASFDVGYLLTEFASNKIRL